MENEKLRCYLCDSNVKIGTPLGLYEELECDNCGKYQISTVAIETQAYIKPTRYIISGNVFDNFYYNKKIILVKAEDFDNAKDLLIKEKIYRLAKYIFTEKSRNKQEIDLSTRLACCYAKDEDEYNSLLDELKSMNVLDFKKTTRNLCGYENPVSTYNNINITTYANMKFENEIISSNQFMEVFMKEKGTTINSLIIKGVFTNSPIAVQSNNNNISNVSTITESYVNEKLIENGISLSVIEAIKTEIGELIAEYNKPTLDKILLDVILNKIKDIGGKLLLSAFNFLVKPEVVEIINRLING